MHRGLVRVVVVAFLFSSAFVLGPERGVQAAGVGISYSVADTSANEGSASTPGVMTFTVTANGAFFSAETVHYQTVNGSAVAGVDYVATSGDLTFSASGTKTVTVPLIGDAAPEADKSFSLVLSNNSSISDDTAVGVIKNDDFTVSVGDTTVTEGDSGSVNASVQITLSSARGADTTVQYATTNGTATAGPDYTAASGTATIPANQQSTTVNFAVAGDTLYEDNETFTVALSGPTSPVTIGDGTATVTILNDDSEPPPDQLPKVSIENAETAEDDTGTHTASFTVRLSGASARTVTVTATTADGTAKSPADYDAKTSTITFPPAGGPQSKLFTVTVKGDELDEANETFNATLSSPAAATLDAAATTAAMTITDDDPTPEVSVSNGQVTEGGVMPFTVSLAVASGRDLAVALTTEDGTATSPADYTAAVAAILTIPAGQTSRTFGVVTAADGVREANETFTLTATLEGQSDEGVGTILDGGGTSGGGSAVITTGAGACCGSHVRVFNGAGAAQAPSAGFFPYRDGPGVRVARGDLDGDGHDEIVVAPGAGHQSIVQVFTPDGGGFVGQVDAYPGFNGGVFVAAGDVDGDGKDEVITSAGPGGGPHVRTFKLVGGSLSGSPGFFAARGDFDGGLTVAAGDTNGDHVDEIVLGAFSNDQPIVYVWNYNPMLGTVTQSASPFLAYAPAFTGGVSVAAGDLDGDGRAEIVTGAGPGGGPHVRVFNGSGSGLPGSAFAYGDAFRGGVYVAVGDVDGDGANEIVTSPGAGGGPHIRSFDIGMQPESTSFFAYDERFAGGVFVATGKA